METHSSLTMAMAFPNYQEIFLSPPFSDVSGACFDGEIGGVCGFNRWEFDDRVLMADFLFSDEVLYQPQNDHFNTGGSMWDSSVWEDNDMNSGSGKQLIIEGSKNGVKEELPCGENSSTGKKRCRGVNLKDDTRVSRLSKEAISQYFYLPIAKAAEELKVGVTYLKKRCRELGIKRWPHRKLMSLQTLINNVQELGKEKGEMGEEYIQVLEQEKKLMEAIPDLRLDDKTKRLRQACFKANYKKRKLMGMMVSSPSTSSCKQMASFVGENFGNSNGLMSVEVDDEEIKCLIENFCASASSDMKLLKY